MGHLSHACAGVVAATLTVLMPSALVAQSAYPYPYPSPASSPYPYPYNQTIPNAPPLEFEVGARYWYSVGKTKKTLFDGTGALQLSRLTWTGETGHTGEAYFNVTDKGVFVKGNLGVGVLAGGKIQDEDFPPVTSPYSSTDSKAGGGHLSYATVDLGYYLLNGAGGKLGPFVGYNVFREKMTAFGCTQTATNTDICVPSIPDSVRVLSQDNTWHSVRVGAAGEMMVAPNLKLSGDAAYLPYVKLSGADTHWLRLGIDFTGPTPETGHGRGVQFEGMLTYYFTDNFSLGVGGRYWRFDVPNGTAHFEDSTGGLAGPQVEKFRTDRYGGFVQLGLKY